MGVTQLKGYGNKSFCWLTVDSGLFWTFTGPIIVVVVGNIVNLLIILKFGVCGISAMAKKSDLEKIKTGAMSVGVLTPIFGITWLIGVFAVNDATSVFQWLFVILNSLQGLMIFIVMCPLDRKVRTAFNEKRRRLFYVESSTSEENTKHEKTNNKITWMQMRSTFATRGNSSKDSPRTETSGGGLSAAYVSGGTTCEVEIRY
ncbi:hypothetical protein DPMN_077404 [Dreissena polymorpha]|uniref:G-protein coupled receptors family 2 profile 2 domain-containing protein n=1 Tax=Dreissena polymorpha TaxID=45954 RepID=A0A9D3YPX4_DREPO|nr:hypothetical protein DPMN_077404 [Dreissena polymorpha]